MKVWYNKVNESRRSMLDVDQPEITVGRDPGNTLVLQSPLVSRRHAVVRRVLAHRRDADTVGQDDVTQLEGFKQMGHGLVP